jgi:acyl-coenzyme A synthetase/AMP-(fatty) acid ligase
MNAGAYRVSPREVEIVFERHPNILEVAVTEIEVKPDVTVIAAFYISTTDIAFNELEELVQSQLARYKHPRVIQRVKALPRTPNGKLIRASLPKLWNKNYD